ncbi:MAG: glycerophosphodiester phosphodiesterase family protein [Beijerinckiaceae bacterium]
MTGASFLVARPVAHRGLHDAAQGVIENTLSAARAAIAKNFAIECDVQRTADNEAVVFHDFTLDRLTKSRGKVSDQSAAALAGVEYQACADRILPLQALLDTVAGQVPLIVEIKSTYDGDLRLTRRTMEALKEYRGPVGVKSFDPDVLIEAKKLADGKIPCGIVAMLDYSYPDYETVDAQRKHALANLLHFGESRPDFISWRVGDLPSAAPYLCRAGMGLPVMTWTVRTAQDRARAKAHADQMVFEGFVPD